MIVGDLGVEVEVDFWWFSYILFSVAEISDLWIATNQSFTFIYFVYQL